MTHILSEFTHIPGRLKIFDSGDPPGASGPPCGRRTSGPHHSLQPVVRLRGSLRRAHLASGSWCRGRTKRWSPNYNPAKAYDILSILPVYSTPNVVVVVLTLTHRHNAVRGHRTGSNNSGVEDYLRRKNHKTEDNNTTT